MLKQSTSQVIMIKPCAFDYNLQTAKTNFFQKKTNNPDSSKTQKMALKEFSQVVELIQEKNIKVKVFEDTLTPHTPDSIFPNNWFSTHQDGNIFIYSMCNSNRRIEKRIDIIDYLKSQNLILKPENDFSKWEEKGLFLEGTGSLVLDRVNKIAYSCLSARTESNLFQEFCQKSGFYGIAFEALDMYKNPIYHTNVVMGIGTNWAYICLDAIPDKKQREEVKKSLISTGHQIIELTQEQVNSFAGNVLELQNPQGEKFILISKTAFNSLTEKQKLETEKFVDWIVPEINTIEQNGGGSVRCMVAEVFSKPKTALIEPI